MQIPSSSATVKSDRPSRPGGCSWAKKISRSVPCSAPLTHAPLQRAQHRIAESPRMATLQLLQHGYQFALVQVIDPVHSRWISCPSIQSHTYVSDLPDVRAGMRLCAARLAVGERDGSSISRVNTPVPQPTSSQRSPSTAASQSRNTAPAARLQCPMKRS